MQQYCFYTEQYKHISEEEQQQGDTVALNMDSVSFSACVLMTPCSCPKTWLSAPCPEWCFTDCLSLNLPLHPCIPLLAYSHLSPPATVWISWGCKQTGATLLPVSLMGRPRLQGRTTSFLKWWLWETRLLATASGNGGGVFWLPISHSLRSQCLSASLMAVPLHCTSSALLVWMQQHLLSQYGRYCPKVKYESIVCFCWHSTETLPYPRTTSVYWQKPAI